jgi:predicted DNA binding CopG/RHH family protein
MTASNENPEQMVSDLNPAEQFLAQMNIELKPVEKESSQLISIKMPESLLRDCEKAAKSRGLTRSGFIKMALTEYLNANKKRFLGV